MSTTLRAVEAKVQAISEDGTLRKYTQVAAEAASSVVKNTSADNPYNFAALLIAAPLVDVGANMLSDSMKARNIGKHLKARSLRKH